MTAIAGIACLQHGCVEAEAAERMAAALGWRGRHDDGAYRSPDGRAALAARRLASVDRGTDAAQPLANETHDIWLVLDGEILNHRTLRHSLELVGHRFRSASNAEVVLHAYEQWGLDFPSHLHGSFALALWDDRRDRLVLARDRLGRKPLFMAEHRGRLAFASGIGPVLAELGLPRHLDPAALAQYLTLGLVPAPATLVAGISKLRPGEMMVADHDGPPRRHTWPGPAPDERRAATIRALSVDRHAGNLRTLLDCAVADRLLGTVPVGVWLSPSAGAGALAAIVQRLTGQPVAAVAVTDGANDAAAFEIALMARHAGLDVRHRTVTADEVAAALPLIAAHLPEPVAGLSLVSAWFAADSLKAARTCCLMADAGAEEMLLGHPAYDGARRAGFLAPLLRLLPPAWRPASGPPPQAPPAALRPWSGGEGGALVTIPLPAAAEPIAAIPAWMRDDALSSLALGDTQVRVADGLAPGLDGIAQAHGLEARLPFLDDVLLNYALAVPGRHRAPASAPRLMARRMLGDIAPAAVITRQRPISPLPMERWLAGPLAHLAAAAPSRWPMLDGAALARLHGRHRATLAEGEALWAILVLAQWCAGLGLERLADPVPQPRELAHSRS